jgi:hypothetical protein
MKNTPDADEQHGEQVVKAEEGVGEAVKEAMIAVAGMGEGGEGQGGKQKTGETFGHDELLGIR